MSTGRLFFALWPDHEVVKRLVGLQEPLDGGRKSHALDLHLTLAFLGAQPADTLPALVSVVDDIEFSSISLVVDQYGQFERQKVVWAGPSQVPLSLIALRDRLLKMPAVAALGLRREAGFVPHLTLARKAPMPSINFEPIEWRVGRMALAESVGGDAVPRYRILACRDV